MANTSDELRQLCADVAASVAVEAQRCLYSAEHYRNVFLSRLAQREAEVTAGASNTECASADDDVEAVARRIIESDRLARGGI